MRLEGKTAVITGAASGIGEASARLFVREGARVIIADIQDDRGQALAAELGDSAVYQRCDVSSEDDVHGAIDAAVSRFGRLDVMFNNAGFLGATGPIEEITTEEYGRTMDVLLRSVFYGMKYAAPVMKQQRSGSIISTASIAALTAGDGPHLYSVAKAGVVMLTRSVALELAEHSVRVNAICPGGIVTPLILLGMPDTQQVREGVTQALSQFQPIPRAGQPEDIANAALWLASDESTFVTGESIVVDGGATTGQPWAKQAPQFRTHAPAK